VIGEEDGVGLAVTDQLLTDRAAVGQLLLVIVGSILHPAAHRRVQDNHL